MVIFNQISVPAVIAQEKPTTVVQENSVESQINAQLAQSVLGQMPNDGASVEDLKKASLELNRDLLILEEELLFPSNTQVSVFLSVDIGDFFDLDAVKLSIDDTLVASHLYTLRQQDTLARGGIQRLYVGNLKTGEHEVTAIFTGIGPDKREYKRGATLTINKDADPLMLELKVEDANSNMQPTFSIKEWEQ